MKPLIPLILFISLCHQLVIAQTPEVSKFTKVDINVLATPSKGSVVPTTDGGYFMGKGLTLTKYDSSNTLVWTQSLSATTATPPYAYIHKINAICDDGQGGAIITGEFNGTLFYGNDSLAPNYVAGSPGLYSSDAFIARVNASGKVWWHRLGEFDNYSTGTDKGISVKFVNNKVYWLAHGTGRNLKFNNVVYPRQEYSNNLSLLSQISLDGTIDWVNVTKGFCQPAELAVQGNSIYYAGFNVGVSTAIDFGNNVTISYNQGSLFAVKYNDLGVAQWAVVYDDDNSITNFNGLAADDDENIYVSGFSSKWTSTFGIRPSSGYLVKINGADGKQIWTRASNAGIKGPVFSGGKVYVAGNTSGSIFLQSSPSDSIEFKRTPTTTGSEQWLATYDKSGTLTGTLKASVAGGLVGSTMEYLMSIENRVIMLGIYSSGNVFGNVTLPMTGGNVGTYFIGFFNIPTQSKPSGIENNFQDTKLSIYPNPATNFFKVETENGSTIQSITLYDLAGKLVWVEPKINQNTASIATTNLNKGIYLVYVSTASGKAIKRIIID